MHISEVERYRAEKDAKMRNGYSLTGEVGGDSSFDRDMRKFEEQRQDKSLRSNEDQNHYHPLDDNYGTKRKEAESSDRVPMIVGTEDPNEQDKSRVT